MAVLKDLIVHGPSRFISAVGFTDLTANKIEADTVKAENGYFTKLKAKTATMDSVVVNELLDVHGELHTKSWSNSNIATVDGNFHIVPTITAATATGTITYTSSAYSMSITGAFATNTLTIGNSTSIVAWTPGSNLIISGEVFVNGEWLPLGTLKCDLGGSSNLATNASSKAVPLVNIKDGNGQVSGVLEVIRETLNLSGTSSTLNFRNVKIAFYSRKNTKMYPIGILLTAQGTGSSKTFIDMYNGNNESSSTYGGLAMPVVRIGNLSGNTSVANNQPLPAVGGQTPTGWGIYTSNGYFSGTIAAEKGKIANFTINGTKLYSNDHSAYDTKVAGIYIGDDYISFGSGGVTYFNTSGTGKIGPWTLTTNAIYNGKTSNNVLVSNPATNTSVAGVYLGTDGLNISNGTAATTAYITKTEVNIGNKLKWNGTTLSVTGKITANEGMIGGFNISNSANTGTSANGGHFYTTSLYAQSGDDTYEYEVGMKGDGNSTTAQSGNLAFYVKRMAKGASWSSATNIFYITKGGTLYAQSADITGKITANSGYIGGTSGWTIASQQLYSGTIGTDNSLHLGTKNLGSNTSIAGRSGSDWRLTVGSKFGVTNTGTFYASAGAIGSSVTIGGTKASTVLTNIVNAATTATTYITDIDDNDGITIKAINGKTSGSDTTKQNYIKLNTKGLEIYQEGISVAKYGDSGTRIGKEGSYNIQIDSNSVDFVNNRDVVASISSEYVASSRKEMHLSSTVDKSECRLSFRNYFNGGSLASFTAEGSNGSEWLILECLDRDSSTNEIKASTNIVMIPEHIGVEGKVVLKRQSYDGYEEVFIAAQERTGFTNNKILSYDASNNCILGQGQWAQNKAGYNTYVEGYETNLWGRNKIATNRAITQGSDKRLKKDIKNLEDVKDFVMDLKPVEFKYEFVNDKAKHLGFIAQDVEKSMDAYGLSSDKYGLTTEITGTDNIQYKGLNYTEFIPICIKMIQEQQQEIDALKEALNEILGN